MKTNKENFIAFLKENNVSFEEKGKVIIVNDKGSVYLSSYNHPLPKDIQFNNGGYVYLPNNEVKEKSGSYIERNNIPVNRKYIFLYKKVSSEFKTQENTSNETIWAIGATLEHPDWNPSKEECGAGKFHACAKPHWCDRFRNIKGDKYIKIKVHINDIYEWTGRSFFPQKIAFRKGTIIEEVNRI